MLKTAICFALLFTVPAMSTAGKWRVYNNAELLHNDFNDGDSFHVMCNNRHYIFRLYFVDTPETSATYKIRVKKQADYFGITVKDVLKTGTIAARFTNRLLSGKKFTVYTKKEDARGNSRRKRYFAMVKIGDQWLSALLVDAGLARIYGMHTDLPEKGKSAGKYIARLKTKEKEAEKLHKGAWRYQQKESGSLRDKWNAVFKH